MPKWGIFRVLIPCGPALAEEARKLRTRLWGPKVPVDVAEDDDGARDPEPEQFVDRDGGR